MHNCLRQIVVINLLFAALSLHSPHALYGQKTTRGVIDAGKTSSGANALEPGSYYALVIGNNNYKYLTKLQTAVNDAKDVAQILRDTYGFSVKVLYDATRDDILTALVEYRKSLPVRSNLLIYYAGHGYEDRVAESAYWLPIDADRDNNQNWISADDITRDVRAIQAHHVLIISDSCYSGMITRGDAEVGINPQDRGAFVARMWSLRSRGLMASGANEPVADGGGGGHSVFAKAILQGLNGMPESQFTASALFQRVQPIVVVGGGQGGQTPQYKTIGNAGESFGDFIFSKGGQAFTAPIETTLIEAVDDGNGVDRAQDTVIPASERDRLPNTVSEAEAIRKVLDTYQQAYNYRDPNLLWKVWPSAPAKMRLDLQSSFKSAASIKMNLQMDAPDVASDGQSAIVRGESSLAYTPRVGSALPVRTDDIVFSLKRDGTSWVIAGVNDQK